MPFLGLDLGTGSLKALVLDREGRTLGAASQAYPLISRMAGRAESDPGTWWRAACSAGREAIAAAGHPLIDGIGLSGQMHGVVLVDERGSPLANAVLWADGRAADQAARFQGLPARQRARLGNPVLPGMAGPILAWLVEHQPADVARSRWALQPKDWLRARLTGEFSTDPSDASGTLLYDVEAEDWALDTAAAVGIRSGLLPPIVPSTAIAGRLVSDPLGIGSVPVVTGAADTAAAAVGTGLLLAGTTQLTVGSGAQAIVLLDDSTRDSAARTHLYRAASARGWYAMAAVQNAGLALEWARRVLDVDWSTLNAQAVDAPRADDPLFVPFLTAERAHQAHGSTLASFRGVRLDHDRDDLLRAVLGGVAFGIRAAVEALPATAPDEPLRLAGGGTTDRGWIQLLADILGRPLVAIDVASASARGAALLAGVGLGAWASVEETGTVAPSIGSTVHPRPDRRAAVLALAARYEDAWAAG